MVSDDDLRDFAEEHIVTGKSLAPVEYNSFSGFCVDYTRGRLFWREWWLRSGNLMIYATYNVDSGKEALESHDLDQILKSLRRHEIQ